MALWKTSRRGSRGMRTSTALATMAATIGLATPALADFPGEKWSVDYVRVEGDAPTGVASAVSLGLRNASEIYFYGGQATHMVATVRDASRGVVDVKLIDTGTGDVVGERRGLSFVGTEGDVEPGSGASRVITNTMKATALSWMGDLGCGDDCAVAVNGGAATQIAAAPPAPETPAEPETKPEPVETPDTVEAPELATTPEPVEDLAPDAVSEPVEEPTAVAAAPAATAPTPIAEPVVAATPADPEPAAKPQAIAKIETPATEITPVQKPTVGDDAPSVAAATVEDNPAAPAVSLASPAVSSARKLDNQTLAEIAEITRGASEPAPSVAPRVDEPAIAAVTPRARPTTTVDQDSGVEVAATSAVPATPTPPTPDLAEPSTGSAAALAGVPLTTDTSIRTADPDTQPSSVTLAPIAETESPAALDSAAADTPQAPADPATEALRLPTPVVRETPQVADADGPDAPQNETPDDETPVIARIEDSDGQVKLINPAARAIGDETLAAALPGEATTLPQPEAPSDSSVDAVLSGEVAVLPPVEAPADTAPEATDDLDGEVLALADPVAPVAPTAPDDAPEVPDAQDTSTAPDLTGGTGEEDPVTTVETKIAAIDPAAEGPTLANARWVGFTPAVFTGSDQRDGAWISGPFDRKQRTGWITDTATGTTTQVTFIWRDAASGGRTATLSRAAAKALGLGQGDVANVAVYLPR